VNLVALRQRRYVEGAATTVKTEECIGVIRRCTVEQQGPVRAVLRLEGVHRGEAGGGDWLPFTVRLVFWAGLDRIDVKHTFIFDGDADKDFVAGLGLRVRVCLEEGPENHHYRVAGENGAVWTEPVRMLPLHHNVPGAGNARAPQFEGRRVEAPPDAGLLPNWGDLQLWQTSADHALLRKRTAAGSTWIDVTHGHRPPGVLSLGTPHGSLAVGIRDFWQSHPTMLQVTGADTPLAWVHAWLWSPESPPMDLRHYTDRDTRPTYEAVNPDVDTRSTAFGIARTSELALFVLPGGATPEAFAAAASTVPQPPQPACAPAWYHRCQAFGPAWSPEDRSSPARARLEDELGAALDFYTREVDQRRWYGFWHYGDVMHSYDHLRGQWFYDLGGYAWDNSELQSDQWLWWNFLRSGRGDVFRLAEAMTRHVSEVDSYHVGPWAPLGSRHNVVHWGCPCKEPRVSQAPPKRFLYYLTANERTGDLLEEILGADRTPSANAPADGLPVMRVNSDWWSVLAAWLVAWERTGDPAWRDRILASIESVLALPRRLMHSDQARYDPATGRLTLWPEAPAYGARLAMIFGGCELGIELDTLLHHPGFAAALEDYARVWAMTAVEFAAYQRERPDVAERVSLRWPIARLVAWTASRQGDAALSRRAWELLLRGDGFNLASDRNNRPFATTTLVRPLGDGPLVAPSEVLGTGVTNQVAQWGLNAIALLALAGDTLTDEVAASKP
jgi:hypothetical protein